LLTYNLPRLLAVAVAVPPHHLPYFLLSQMRVCVRTSCIRDWILNH